MLFQLSILLFITELLASKYSLLLPHPSTEASCQTTQEQVTLAAETQNGILLAVDNFNLLLFSFIFHIDLP